MSRRTQVRRCRVRAKLGSGLHMYGTGKHTPRNRSRGDPDVRSGVDTDTVAVPVRESEEQAARRRIR
jgi:hypothetical protein